MLTELKLISFKSFADQTIKFGPATLLIGANASGKSNVLDALRFVLGVVQGIPVAEVLQGRWEGGREVWNGIRGGAAEVGHRGDERFIIQGFWHVDDESFLYTVAISLNPEPLLFAEELQINDTQIFSTHKDSMGASMGTTAGTVRVGLKGSRAGRSPVREYPATRSVLGQIEAAPDVSTFVVPVIARFREAVRNVVFLDVRPAQMRQHVPKRMPSIGANAENLSAVLWQMSQDPDRKRDLIDWLLELCAPEIDDLLFDESSLLEEVMLVVKEKDGSQISARSLSDGTLRFLGQLAALKTSNGGSLQLIEEIENGLHPTRIHLLIELIEAVTKGGTRQVIATTHSPAALAALSSEGLRNAVVFGRRPAETGSIARRLGDLPNFDEVEARRGIEHLFTTQWLERAL